MTQLLPCPFCGCPADKPQKRYPTGRPIWEISCSLFCVGMKREKKSLLIGIPETRLMLVGGNRNETGLLPCES